MLRKNRFDQQTQIRINDLYAFIIKTIQREEWERVTNLTGQHDYLEYWRHKETGMLLTGYRNSDYYEKRSSYQPYDPVEKTTHENPFNRKQRRWIRKLMTDMWSEQRRRDEHARLADFITTTHQQIKKKPQPQPHPVQIEQAAEEVKTWIKEDQ